MSNIGPCDIVIGGVAHGYESTAIGSVALGPECTAFGNEFITIDRSLGPYDNSGWCCALAGKTPPTLGGLARSLEELTQSLENLSKRLDNIDQRLTALEYAPPDRGGPGYQEAKSNWTTNAGGHSPN